MILQLLSGSWLQICLIGLVAGMIVNWLIQKHRYKLPPGPLPLPFIGNVLEMTDNFLHETSFKKWSKKYGPVVSVRFGTLLIVFINDIEHAMDVLVKRSTEFAGRLLLPSLELLSSGGKDIAFADYGPTWKLQRRIASKALSYDFDNHELNSILKLRDKVFENFGVGLLEDFVPAIKYVYKTSNWKNLEELTTQIVHDFMERKFRNEEKLFDKGNIRHFTDTLLLARLEAQDEHGAEELKNLTDMHLIQTCTDIFFGDKLYEPSCFVLFTAGVDTTRLTLRYAILHMIAFPDIQEKVQEEIDRKVGNGRLPGLADRPTLSYTEAVLHESMRLSSVVPLGVLHKATCDTELAGYRIPKGTQIAINHWALHHDPDAWEDVERFIPERYLDEDGKMGPKPSNWLPFGAGKRVCLGEFVAKPELHLLFASLMQRFKWRSISGTALNLSPDGSMVQLSPKPYKVVITKRI